MSYDESWLHHFDPDTKAQSMQYKYPSSSAINKAKVASSTGRGETSVSGVARVLMVIDYLQKSYTINREHYANVLTQL